MRVKMGVWEPGKADPSRYDRAANLDEFVENLLKLNPGDEVSLFFIENGANQHDIVTLPVRQEEPQLVDVVAGAVWDIDQKSGEALTSVVTGHAPEPPKLTACFPFEKVHGEGTVVPQGTWISALDMTVVSNKPTLYQDLYNAVTDILALGGWLSAEQQAIIDENVLRIVREHDRV